MSKLGLNIENGKLTVQDVISRLLAMKNGEDLSEFDKSKSNDTTYCVDWGIKKGEWIVDGIIDRYIKELKTTTSTTIESKQNDFINKLLDDIHNIDPELSLKRQTEFNKMQIKEEKTPMQQLIEKIDLYEKTGGINMITLKSVLQSYLQLETKYLERYKYEF